ncbi:TetR/AcrR family transcriptional regulator [Pseudomonas sp. NPDC090202]|uniref:TetR/AcrR family transcriptional regulator n=1 Tax=unclassified Pseudomonas TaxID=196821 RepID=UPI0038212C25
MYIMPFDARLDAKHPPVRPVRGRPPLSGPDVRDSIVRAASEAFAQDGFAATTVESVAQRAGLPKSNVLYYFKSKENIYAQVLADIAAVYLETCSPFEDEEEPLDAMVRKVTAMIRLFEQRPSAARVFMVELRQGAPRLPQAWFTQWTAHARQSAACLRRWIDRGLLAPVDPDHLLLTLAAMAQSCIGFGWQMPGQDAPDHRTAADYEAAVTTATRLLLRGLAPEKSPA